MGTARVCARAVEAHAVLEALPDGAPVAVSACLLGTPCRYDGQQRRNQTVLDAIARLTVIPICPEGAGGLPVPRPPAEAQPDGRIVLRDGRDVSEQFALGAARSLERVRESGASVAILKAHSPSCGVGQVYDGTFSGRLRTGDGVATRLLMDAGVSVLDERELRDLSSQE